MYPEEIVKPMREELTLNGFKELFSPQDVDDVLSKEGTTLVVVNSICGCAAANARPGVIKSLSNEKTPDQLATVFAGVDKEATDAARSKMIPFPPSSPSSTSRPRTRHHPEPVVRPVTAKASGSRNRA